jgi:hypothetical protein
MKYTSKSNIKRQYYLPREVAEMLGREAELIPNAYALVMFPKGSPTRKVLRSLAVIQHDLENQIATEEEDKGTEIPEGSQVQDKPGVEKRLENIEHSVGKLESVFDKMRREIREAKIREESQR